MDGPQAELCSRIPPMSSIVPKLDRYESLAADLADYLRQIDDVDADAGNLLNGMTETNFTGRRLPRTGRLRNAWFTLVIMGRRYLPVLDEAIEKRARGPPTGPWAFPLRFHGEVDCAGHRTSAGHPAEEPPLRRGRPTISLLPDSGEFPNDARRAAQADSCGQGDRSRAREDDFALREVAQIGPGPCFAFLIAHERRHLWQAWQVRKDEGFPRQLF